MKVTFPHLPNKNHNNKGKETKKRKRKKSRKRIDSRVGQIFCHLINTESETSPAAKSEEKRMFSQATENENVSFSVDQKAT